VSLGGGVGAVGDALRPRKVFRKLGVKSRTQLANRLMRGSD